MRFPPRDRTVPQDWFSPSTSRSHQLARGRLSVSRYVFVWRPGAQVRRLSGQTVALRGWQMQSEQVDRSFVYLTREGPSRLHLADRVRYRMMGSDVFCTSIAVS